MQSGRSSYAFEVDFNEDHDGLSGAAEVVHDLGNLIQIAVSAVNIIARSPRISHDPGLEPILVRAKASLESASALVRQTVGRSRSSTALTRVSRESVDVVACVSEIRSLIAWICTPDITLTSDIASDLPAVRCSALDLQNALLNLLINARDAMPEGGEISIIGRCRDFGAAVEFAIQDTGLGMDAATRLRAFNPWFTTKGEGQGSGLGLATVKRFADDAGGRVDIWSAPGVGTTVTLRLPTARPEPGSDDSQKPPPSGVSPGSGGRPILW